MQQDVQTDATCNIQSHFLGVFVSGTVHFFFFLGGGGAGGIRRVAPIVYNGPPLHKKF